jgi:hypothetical protein
VFSELQKLYKFNIRNYLNVTKQDVYQINSIIPSQGDMIKVTKEENNKPTEIGGSFGDIWHTLESALNFS